MQVFLRPLRVSARFVCQNSFLSSSTRRESYRGDLAERLSFVVISAAGAYTRYGTATEHKPQPVAISSKLLGASCVER